MNPELEQLALEAGLHDPAYLHERLVFGMACVARIRHLVTEPRALELMMTGEQFVAGKCSTEVLAAAAAQAVQLARSHPGSRSLDGGAHAAVSATHAVAKALTGQAVDAAGYAAYAMVYAYGGYAVNDPSSFESEHVWQVAVLRELLAKTREIA